MTKALIDADRGKRKGRNKYTADSFINDTHKKCSWCDQIKEHLEFHKDKKNIYGRGLAYYCKECANTKARNLHNRQKTNLDYVKSKRSRYFKTKYGLSLVEHEQKLASQNYLCKICGTHLESKGALTHLDHCHKTGKIRDFLCTNCNRGLGSFKDSKENLMEAIKYLQSHTDDGNQKEGRCL